MDVTVIVAIAIGGLVVAVLTHIKDSECWGVKPGGYDSGHS